MVARGLGNFLHLTEASSEINVYLMILHAPFVNGVKISKLVTGRKVTFLMHFRDNDN
jgi:hypothetical protein